MSFEGIIKPDKSMVTYGSYLKVPELLSLQVPLSSPEEHDETLFIIIHQVYELWFKQILHELNLAETYLSQKNLIMFNKAIRRVITIQEVLTKQVDILETMTPVDFNRFRERLNPASGFQSYQFRELEFRMGIRDNRYLKYYEKEPDKGARLESFLSQPSFYDLFLSYLAQEGHAISEHVLNRDLSKSYESSEEVRNIFINIYKNADQHFELYMVLESMMDLDQDFTLWRYRHVAMVERMIGRRMGTGGSSGVKYLESTLAKRFFPEIWEARSYLGE